MEIMPLSRGLWIYLFFSAHFPGFESAGGYRGREDKEKLNLLPLGGRRREMLFSPSAAKTPPHPPR